MVAITRTQCRAGAFTMIAQGCQSLRIHRHQGGKLAIANGAVSANHSDFLTFAKIDTVELHVLGGAKVFWMPDVGNDVLEAIGW